MKAARKMDSHFQAKLYLGAANTFIVLESLSVGAPSLGESSVDA